MTNFWHVDIGNVITALVVIVTIAVAWGRLSARNEEQGREIARHDEQILKIDLHGTSWSQRGLGVETELTRSNTRRLDNQDRIMAAIPADIAAMKTDLHWIKESLRSFCPQFSRGTSYPSPCASDKPPNE